MQLKPDHRILNVRWTTWISSGIDEIGYVVDDPHRPTENQAIRNIRDRAKLRYHVYKQRVLWKKLGIDRSVKRTLRSELFQSI